MGQNWLNALFAVFDWARCVGLASYRGSKTGGHSHGTRTHQQVLVMGVILGLDVKDSGIDKQGWARQPGGGWKRGTETWEVTVNLHARHYLYNKTSTQTKSKRWPKQRHEGNRQGREWAGQEKDRQEETVTRFPFLLTHLVKLKQCRLVASKVGVQTLIWAIKP